MQHIKSVFPLNWYCLLTLNGWWHSQTGFVRSLHCCVDSLLHKLNINNLRDATGAQKSPNISEELHNLLTARGRGRVEDCLTGGVGAHRAGNNGEIKAPLVSSSVTSHRACSSPPLLLPLGQVHGEGEAAASVWSRTSTEASPKYSLWSGPSWHRLRHPRRHYTTKGRSEDELWSHHLDPTVRPALLP